MASGKSPDAHVTRRSFIKGIGLATAGTVGVGGAIALRPQGQGTAAAASVNFSRMFPELRPFFADLTPAGATDNLRAALTDIGKLGGILDAKDILLDPVKLITDPSVNGNDPPTNPDNPTHTAGVTFFGQFMDLDMTFDHGSVLGTPTDPLKTQNSRIPYFDLDSVYGDGPVGSAQYYDPGDIAKLRIESGGIFEDLPRASDMTAIIAEPRADQNLMVAGLQCAFILFHNRAVDFVRAQGALTDVTQVFNEAKRLTLWHYHWLILKEFLPLFSGPALVVDILTRGPQHYRPEVGQATMPIEFQGAAFRCGHTMVRPSYRANLKGDKGNPFFGFIFDPKLGDMRSAAGVDPSDLRGGFRSARRFIGWQTFFDFKDGQVKPNKQMDAKLSSPLFSLPLGAIASHKPPIALPQRNLLRHITWSMPSGQAIAEAMNVERLTANDLDELRPYGLGLESSTPLWYYILKEAALVPNTDIGKNKGGFHLGPVGGRIVGEVVIGMLQADASSWIVRQPGWTPTLQRPGPDFRMTDFLTFAGVDPATRHAQQPNLA